MVHHLWFTHVIPHKGAYKAGAVQQGGCWQIPWQVQQHHLFWTRSHFTNDFLLQKLYSARNKFYNFNWIDSRSLQNFAHATAALLSWHMQNLCSDYLFLHSKLHKIYIIDLWVIRHSLVTRPLDPINTWVSTAKSTKPCLASVLFMGAILEIDGPLSTQAIHS